ncbi:MAG TPA: phosphatase, partial [Synergistales bacterium]|nr:phosphatase [Synergistales bacterium]
RAGLKFGAIDCGSNSVRCLAVLHRDGILEYVDSGAWITRLTEGIESGEYRIAPKAVERTAVAITEAKDLLERSGVGPERTVFFATESLRSAANGAFAVAELERAAGLALRVLGGEEEAALGRRGALLGTRGAGCVFDLGGGSLEIGWDGSSLSIPAGAVRMKARFEEDREKTGEEILNLLAGKGIPSPEEVVGTGGTSSSIVMMLQGVPVTDYHPARIHGYLVSAAELDELAEKLVNAPVEDRMRIVGLDPKRADIIVAGIFVIRTLLDLFRVSGYTHSETDLLWGVCAEKAAAEGLPVFSAKIG